MNQIVTSRHRKSKMMRNILLIQILLLVEISVQAKYCDSYHLVDKTGKFFMNPFTGKYDSIYEEGIGRFLLFKEIRVEVNGHTYLRLFTESNFLIIDAELRVELLDGKVTLYNYGIPNSINTTCSFISNKIEGLCIHFISPQVRLISSYRNGKKNGLQFILRSDGTIDSVQYFRRGKFRRN